MDFPVFQPSTPDPAPASNQAQCSPGEASGSGDAERPKEPSTAQSHTPGEASLSLALSLGHSTDSLGAYGDGAEVQQKVDRQPSTVEYLPGMTHSACPKGLLPTFSSWSLVKLGPAKSYNVHTGLEQPSFLPGSSFLLPWDVVIRSRSEEDAGLTDGLDGGTSSWPAPNKTLMGKRGSTGGLGRNRRREDMARVFVGFEYEDGRGRRFISSGPDKIVKVLGPGGTKDPATRVLNADMPLYIPSPSQGRGLKPHFAQLIRLFVVVPDAPLEVSLSPQVNTPSTILTVHQRGETRGLFCILNMKKTIKLNKGMCIFRSSPVPLPAHSSILNRRTSCCPPMGFGCCASLIPTRRTTAPVCPPRRTSLSTTTRCCGGS